ncbi:MAG: hypothetical protein KIS67_29140, partial [Verrucomicrobiae bacterium]|nr:hypothetical protein [Verrucomicrobiae bacterium]
MAQDSQVPAAGSLFDRVAHTPAVQSLAQRLERGGALSWPGVCPAAQPFLAALLHALFPKRALVVVTDGLKTQEAFQQDLQTWLQMKTNVNGLKPRATSTQSFLLRTQPLFYPAWEVLPHEGRLPHADAISDRLETLVTLSRREEPETEESPIIVTSVTALLQRTFPPETLRDRTRVLERGDRANPLDLVEWLEEQGYEPEAQVTQKGEMALRGGILDVFPPTNPWPVRLEFFGDELESLREFDPLTQISRGEVAAVTLPPAGELGILKRDLERGSATHSKSNPSIASSCGSTIGAPLATFLQHLPDSAIFLLCEPEQLAVRADEYAAHVPAGDPFLVEWNALLVELDRREMTRVDFSEVPFALISGLPPGERENLWPTHDKPATDGDSASTESSRRGERLSPSPAGEISPNPDSRFEPPNRNRRREEADSSELQRCPPPHVGGYKRRDRGEGKGERESSFEQCAADVPNFTSLDAFRPVSERAPDPQIAEAQRREFFNQLHRWLRQGFDLHVFCNNAGERQRFEEIWSELAGPAPRLAPVEKHSEEVSVCCDACPTLHIGALSRGFLLGAAKLVVVTDAEIFGRYKVQRPRRLKSPHAAAMRSALEIDFADLEYGDLVVHLQYGIGRYLGLKMLPAGAGQRPSALGDPPPETECLVIEYAPGDPAHEAPKLYVPVSESHLVSKYVGAGRAHPPLNTLGGTRWRKAKEQAAQAVRDVAAELLRIQAAREAQAGHAFKPDAPWQREFESAFIYEETPDQFRAIGETKLDMEKPKPMDRLICGDVGFGKTE